jgi:pyruvate dehydrogenase E1 component alpha subunit
MITDHTIDSLRGFEERVAEHFNAGRIRAPVHLSGGNEQQLLDIFKNVREQDWVATNWRSHYACLLKGIPPATLMGDIVAGHSITLNYPAYRILSSAIVGGALPIAVGVAWAIKRRGEDAKVWAFVGDMAAMSGIFHECRRYADGHSLPIHFVIEDNGKSVCSDTYATWGMDNQRPKGGDHYYRYVLSYPHAGAGRRVEF